MAPTPDERRRAGDDMTGLFGPDSVTWRVHADPLLIVGGIRALLMQALHPLALAGVVEHSGFREDPWGRLGRTAEFVATLSYGTRSDALKAAARVRGAHRGLVGIEPDSDTPYRVDDPALLLWVHCCEVDSFLSTARRSGVELSEADADRYLSEQVRAAELVGIPADDVPADRNDLATYFTDMAPMLRATAEATRALRFLLAPPMPAWVRVLTPARPAWGGIAALSFALLPPWARRMYRMPGLATTDAAATAGVRALRTSLQTLPVRWREGPALRAARERLAG
ncbi:MAG: DUF2236 domain-containing protein [Geodermatophilaceae bacterium]|nr:DUF2236 domain-containing protein [Geodermatophilaceae bacterium]